MQRFLLLCLFFGVMTLAGCGTSVTGQWKSEGFHGDGDKAGKTALTIRGDKTFSLSMENADGKLTEGAAGRWEKESDTRYRLIQDAGTGPKVRIAEIQDGKLVLTDDSGATRFSK